MIDVPLLLTANDDAGVEPNATAVAPVKFVPVIVTLVPPAVGPVEGATPNTVGAGTYVNSSPGPVALVTPAVVTVTSTTPDPCGEVAVIDVPLPLTTNVDAGFEPNATAVAPVKFVPAIVTLVPPAVGPVDGATPDTVGRGGTYVNSSPGPVALVPPAVVTVTSTTPDPCGEVAVIDVGLLTTTNDAGFEPNVTVGVGLPSQERRLLPVIVTIVPPATGPDEGLTVDTTGCWAGRCPDARAGRAWLLGTHASIASATPTIPSNRPRAVRRSTTGRPTRRR